MADFDTAAREEAERRYPDRAVLFGGETVEDMRVAAFEAGARWGRAQRDALALVSARKALRFQERAERAEAALAEVAALHHHRTSDDGRTDWCDLCEDGPWPCATARVLARATQTGADR